MRKERKKIMKTKVKIVNKYAAKCVKRSQAVWFWREGFNALHSDPAGKGSTAAP